MGRGGFNKKCKLRKSRTGSNRNVQGDKVQEPRHRASPKRIVSLYPHLTPEQRELVKEAGFGGLLDICCPKLPYGLCGWLLERFDTDYCELVIKGRGRIPITSDSVHRVLGIPNRGGDVKYHLDAGAITFMTDKYDVVNGYSPTLTSIGKSLKQMKSADEHFLRTFMVLVVSSFLCPTTSLRISPRCFPSLVDIGSIRELNWCKFVVEQLKKSVSAYGRKNSVPGCLFYLVILYLDLLDTGDTQIPDGTPRISAWNTKLVDKVIEMDMKNNGSFGKCLLKKRVGIIFRGASTSSASAIFGGVSEIANFVSSNVVPGYSPQKKEVLCNAVGKFCASVTDALSKFMHEVSGLEGCSGEAGEDRAAALQEVNNLKKDSGRRDEDMLSEDSSELPTEDMEDTSAEEYEDETCGEGEASDKSSTDESEDDPDWEYEYKSRKKNCGDTEADGATKFAEGTHKSLGHDSGTPQENQDAGNGCTKEHANLAKRTPDGVDGDVSQAGSTQQKTGEKRHKIVDKMVVQSTGSKKNCRNTEPGDGATKSVEGTQKGSGHDSSTPKENQDTGNGCTKEHANLAERTPPGFGGDVSQAGSTLPKTGEKKRKIVDNMVPQSTSTKKKCGKTEPRDGPSSCSLMLCDDERPVKVEEDTEKTPIIDLCTPTSSESSDSH